MQCREPGRQQLLRKLRARLGTACLQCGYGNSPTARFCGSCGSALGITAATWMEWPHFEEISLSELSADETGALVTELIGSHPELNEIRRRVILRSSGNPFFAEELVRSLEENCEVVGEIGDYRLGTTIAEGVLPAPSTCRVGSAGFSPLVRRSGFIANPCCRFRPRPEMFGSWKLYARQQ